LAFAEDDALYVASQNLNRVLVFRPDGTYLRQLTAEGLKEPTSLAFSPEGKLHVASFGTDEVFVFKHDVLESKIGVPGLDGPNCIAFIDETMLVASQLTNDVHIIHPAGGRTRFTGGTLSSPMGIAVYEDGVYVTGGASHTVTVFDREGAFLREIHGSGSELILNGPQGIAFDGDGNFAVSSYYTGRVGLFSLDGELLRTFDDSGVRTARSVAFLPLRPKQVPFIRGDGNRDGRVDLSDAFAILFELFIASICTVCPDALDADDSGTIDMTDAIYILTFLFLGGPALTAPFPDAGADPTQDSWHDCLAGRGCIH
jgi:hypothetical protein